MKQKREAEALLGLLSFSFGVALFVSALQGIFPGSRFASPLQYPPVVAGVAGLFLGAGSLAMLDPLKIVVSSLFRSSRL